MEYRREIDGLRALAVLPVIFFHAGFDLFSGGFVGVDVFFVISGYLITTIILAELKNEKFSLGNFYERRARRILPVLFAVMFVCIPFSWVFLPPSELINFAKSLIAVPLFVSNMFFMSTGEYFETAAELKPLLHTWSLAVEEQYYVLFPLFLMSAWRWGIRRIVLFLAVIFVVSLAIAQWGAITHPTAAFFLLPMRMWELLIGAFSAFYLSRVSLAKNDVLSHELAGWTGVSLIALSIFIFDSQTPFPGLYALAPTLGAVLIILFATQETFVGRFIGSKLFVGIGLVSYSAYLWHQPVLAYARYWFHDIDYLLKLILIGMVFFLSFFSWKYIEQPFRVKSRYSRRYVFVGSIVGGLFFIVVGLFISKLNFQRENLMAKVLLSNAAIYSTNINDRSFVKYRIQYESDNPDMMVIGSSRQMQIGSHIAGKKVLNFSVSGASVEDAVSIWYMASKKIQPNTVLIGGDPWLFNKNSGQNRWSANGYEYQLGLDELNLSVESVSFKRQGVSSVGNVMAEWYNAVNLSKIEADDDRPDVVDKIRRDGSRVYNKIYANKSLGEIEKNLEDFASYAMTNYSDSVEAKKIFESLVAHINNGHTAVIVLSPYHPKLYERMKSDYPIFIEAEQWYRSFSTKHAIKIIGSYDPANVGCVASEFYDGMHPKDVCVKKILQQLNSSL